MKSAHHRLYHDGATVVVVMAFGVLPLLWMLSPVAAQTTDIASVAQQTGLSAALHKGECSAIGEVVAPLTNALIPSGSPVGNPDALPAASSFTAIPLPLETLLAADHAIVVADPAGNGAIACGEIGGFQAETGSLAIGLAGEQSSGVHGIAYLNPGVTVGRPGFRYS